MAHKTHNLSLQNEVDASNVKTSEMQTQQDGFDSQMAKAELEAGSMRMAYEQLKCDNADQMETAVQVGPYGAGWFS